MNKWILAYDDGRTAAIHTTEVEAETVADALAASGLPPKHVWVCALHDRLKSAAAYLITVRRAMKISTAPTKAEVEQKELVVLGLVRAVAARPDIEFGARVIIPKQFLL